MRGSPSFPAGGVRAGAARARPRGRGRAGGVAGGAGGRWAAGGGRPGAARAPNTAEPPPPPPIRYGIGLHLGEVTYGNIGVPSRLEFTVIGPAANAAARVESMCKTLGRN